MRPDIQEEVITQLIQDYALKTGGTWLQYGKCPQCKKKELYANKQSPWVIKCGRETCGFLEDTKNLYPEIFENFNQRYQATKESPNATAEAYLRYARGLPSKDTQGHYEQGKFWHPEGDKGTATVRFYLDRPNDIFMERFIEPVQVKGERKPRKAHFNGARKGLLWQPAGQQINPGDTVWWVEGCIDALSLHAMGHKAIATLAANNFPEKSLEPHRHKGVTWVLALDNDVTGQKYTEKWIKNLKAIGEVFRVAFIPATGKKKRDWNDQYQAEQLSVKHLKNYYYQGDLFSATTAFNKALLMWRKTNQNGFTLDFKSQLYWFQIDIEKYTDAYTYIIDEKADGAVIDDEAKNIARQKAAESTSTVKRISNCLPKILYFLESKSTNQAWYYLSVQIPFLGRYKRAFTPPQLSSAAEFKRGLLSVGSANFTGKNNHLDYYIEEQFKGLMRVNTIDYIGYSKAHEAYIFDQFAIHHGKVYQLNDNDYFEIGDQSIKSIYTDMAIDQGTKDAYQADWVDYLDIAFGAKGLVALTFWFGILFVEQIRGLQSSYPFMEMIGEGGGGKTTLIEFLWKLIGRPNDEGFNPEIANTKGVLRKLCQVSNLPISFIEADSESNNASARKKFTWNFFKPLYNARTVTVKGQRTQGHETQEPDFMGAIMISQNESVDGDNALLQRLVHLSIDKSQQNEQTYKAAVHLEGMSVSQLSYFLQHVLIQEKSILKIFTENIKGYRQDLIETPNIHTDRIIKCHSQMMALADALKDAIGLTPQQHSKILLELVHMAQEREIAINKDHPVVKEFWEIHDYLENDESTPVVNHSKNKNIIAINLNHFSEVAQKHKQKIPDLIDLKKYLIEGKERPLIEKNKAVCSNILYDGSGKPKTLKCLTFKKTKKVN